jgi:hypothetical protein
MKKAMTIGLAAIMMFVAACQMTSCGKAKADSATARPLRVGVYDSRAIAVACLRSEWWNKQIQEKMKERDKAKAAGDTQKVKELEEWGQSSQTKAHLQGFGTAPVQTLLEPVKDKLPQVAQQTGVDIIVSKWQIDYQPKDAQFVDVTDAMVALYNPNERALKSIESMKKIKPLSEEEVLNIKD